MQKFYCDNCGAKVNRDAPKCPQCGRFFKSVRCPSCGLTGSPDLFVNGCPSCGYAEEKIREGQDFYDIDGNNHRHIQRKTRNERRIFTDLFYKRAIPVLILLIILLFFILIKTGW